MRFIDLFARLGGFHTALKQLGLECVFASEIDEGSLDLYLKHFGLVPQGEYSRRGLTGAESGIILLRVNR
jgi:DNA (cytosine-5)-methyltransferase 1